LPSIDGNIEVRQKLGEEIVRIKNGYWRDWKNYSPEMKRVVDKLGHFPTSTELEKIEMLQK